MTFIAPRPERQYNERNESEFRSALERFLRALETGEVAATVAPRDVTFITTNSANSTVTAVPAAVTEWQGQPRWRFRIDLTGYTEVQLSTQVTAAGSASAKMRLQYTTDLTGASGWDYLDAVSGPSVGVSSTGNKANTVSITAAAQTEVLVRPVTIDGDAATNLSVGLSRAVFT